MDVGKKDIRNMILSSQLNENKSFLKKKYKKLKTQEVSNPYLEGITKEYKCFHDDCLLEKKKQIQHMDGLVKYLSFHNDIHHVLNHDIKKINKTKKDLMEEIKKLIS